MLPPLCLYDALARELHPSAVPYRALSSRESSEKNCCDQTIPVPVLYRYSIIPFLKFFFRSSSENNSLVSSSGFEPE